MNSDFLIIQLLIAAYWSSELSSIFLVPVMSIIVEVKNLWNGRFCPFHSCFPVPLGVTVILQDGSAQFQGIVCCYILSFCSYQNPVSRKEKP